MSQITKINLYIWGKIILVIENQNQNNKLVLPF